MADDIKAALVHGDIATTDATKTFTDSSIFGGATPKFAIIHVGTGTSGGIMYPDAIFGSGILDDADNQAGISWAENDNFTTTRSSRGQSSTSAIYLRNYDNTLTWCEYTAELIADGIKFTRVGTSSFVMKVRVTLIGGDGVVACQAGTHGMGILTTDQVVTTTGVNPNLMYYMSHCGTYGDNTNAIYAEGWTGNHHGGALKAVESCIGTATGLADSTTACAVHEDSGDGCVSMRQLHIINATTTWTMETTSLNTGSFTIKTPISSGTDVVNYIAIEMADPYRININSTEIPTNPISTPPDYPGVNGQVVASIGCHIDGAQVRGTDYNANCFAANYVMADHEKFTITGLYSQDGLTVSDVGRIQDSGFQYQTIFGLLYGSGRHSINPSGHTEASPYRWNPTAMSGWPARKAMGYMVSFCNAPVDLMDGASKVERVYHGSNRMTGFAIGSNVRWEDTSI